MKRSEKVALEYPTGGRHGLCQRYATHAAQSSAKCTVGSRFGSVRLGLGFGNFYMIIYIAALHNPICYRFPTSLPFALYFCVNFIFLFRLFLFRKKVKRTQNSFTIWVPARRQFLMGREREGSLENKAKVYRIPETQLKLSGNVACLAGFDPK